MRKYGLSIVLGVLFLVSWVGQIVVEWVLVRADARVHGEPFHARDAILHIAQSTLENWQSEFLQLATFVLLTVVFIHKGSPQSKDGMERLEGKVDAILEHLRGERRV